MTRDNMNQNKQNETEQSQSQPDVVDSVGQDETTSQLAKLQKDLADLTDLLKRNQAEFENYQKRVDAQTQQVAAFASQRIITRLVPIVDMFELALKHKENVVEFMSGVEMIHHSFAQMLADEHVTIPTLVGEKFDPRFARAVGTRVVDGKDAGIVLEVMSKCYVLYDRVVRHANVIVSASPVTNHSQDELSMGNYSNNSTGKKNNGSSTGSSKQSTL